MLYYLYEIKNNINGKIYVGVHKTKNVNDDYFGSGKVLREAIKKYGKENFSKTINEYFDSAELMFAREKEIVNDEFLKRGDVYNLRRGGQGGFDFINNTGILKFKGKKHSEKSKLKMGHPGNTYFKGHTISIAHKEIISKVVSAKLKNVAKTNEHKNKISESLLGKKHVLSVCPHCGLICSERLIKRWHLDKCKSKR